MSGSPRGQQQQQQQHGGHGQHQEGWKLQQEEQEQQQALGDQQLLPSGSGGMSTADTFQMQAVLGKARVVVALGRALVRKLAGPEETCQGGNEPITGGSSSKGGDISIAGNSQGALGHNSGQHSSSSSEDIVVPPSAACQMILVQVTTAALQLRECVADWQRTACVQPTVVVEHATPRSFSSAPIAAAAATTPSAAAAANMVTVAVLGDVTANGQAALRDGSLDTMAAAGSGGGIAALVGSAGPGAAETAAVVLPERFCLVTARGLPKDVMDQLDHSRSFYGAPVWWEGDPPGPEDILRIVQGLAEVTPLQGQLDMLQYLVLLGEVLLAEVACALGCSNPGCVNLAGESEVREAGKVCAACKVVYYCSRRCQVEHWKAGHGKVCGRLGQQDKQQEQVLQ